MLRWQANLLLPLATIHVPIRPTAATIAQCNLSAEQDWDMV